MRQCFSLPRTDVRGKVMVCFFPNNALRRDDQNEPAPTQAGPHIFPRTLSFTSRCSILISIAMATAK